MKLLLIFLLTLYIPDVLGQGSSFDSIAFRELKQQVSQASIIGLGEVGHGYESINEVKSYLAEVLHREFDFEAICFESSFTGSVVSFFNKDPLDFRLRNFLYPFWNTATVKTGLQSFYDSEKSKGKPLILGFDIQEDCRFQNFSSWLLQNKIVFKSRDKLIASDSILSFYIGKHFSRKTPLKNQELVLLNSWLETIREEVRLKNMDTLGQKLLLRCFDNRKWLLTYLAINSVRERMYYRDSLMAENIKWIKNELFSQGKLILWSADAHIARHTNSRKPEWNGEWLSELYRKGYFSVSFQKGKSGSKWFWENTSFLYKPDSGNKFDMVIFMKKVWKIRKEEWITPCN